MNGFTKADVPDKSGKCFVITGANTGLGFEAARVLASRGVRALLGCRNAEGAGRDRAYPRKIVFETLPETATSKIRRFALRHSETKP